MVEENKTKKDSIINMPIDMTLENGYTYLIKDPYKDLKTQLNTFRESEGEDVLYITRNSPDNVKKTNDILSRTMIWLTFNKGPNCIEPTNITRLSLRIQDFLKRNKSGTILFDGLEYLTSQNDFTTILHFLQLVNDKIMISDSKMILSLNPSAFRPQELALIEREMESLTKNIEFKIENNSK
jgi:hypothetical protein